MSIEQALAANTEAVEKLSQLLTDLYQVSIQNGVADAAPCEVEPPPGRMVQDGKSTDAPVSHKEVGYTKDDVIKVLMELFKVTKTEEHTAEILGKFGVKSVHQVNESDYSEVINRANAKLTKLEKSK